MTQQVSKYIQRALEKIENHKQKPQGEKARQMEAIELAALILNEALRIQTRSEKKAQREIARMMQDPRGKAFTMMMTDECFRARSASRVADQLVYLLKQFGIPRYADLMKRLQLQFFKVHGKHLSFLLVPIAKYALRKTTSKVILPGERAALSKHMAKRRAEGVRINLNHLGEAILGEEEAVRRLNVYLRDLEAGDVEYVSIKISTIYSQINLLDWEKSFYILSERLRQLYRAAMKHKFKKADGLEVIKFVNLDMEEYHDLHLTKELFMRVLDEEEFLQYEAGIVLQAYIPDSYSIQQELTEWAMKRQTRGGAPIKIRIVKGANLAMEKVEASMYNWFQTPYKTKAEVDANYKRMLLYGCKPQHAKAVHLGIASHNLFDIAYAMLARVEFGVEEMVSFEMLEGMADHMRRVVQKLSGSILLYCPVAEKRDFQSAIAYLIRRLDENTGEENFLRHSFGLKPGTDAWKEQVQLFEKACEDLDHVGQQPRRQQNRYDPPDHLPFDAPFALEIETDFSLPQNQKWGIEVLETWKEKTFDEIPLVIAGKQHKRDQKGEGICPSSPHESLYQYSLATWEDIDTALNTAKATEASWGSTPPIERAKLISKVAEKMRERRSDLMGVMMRDGGKSIFETEPEVAEAIDFAEYYLRSMLDYGAMEEVEFTPKGTVLVAPPWNFPISIPAGGVCAALVTGNCVLFKPAPEAVLSGWILANVFWDAGIPKDVLQFINCVDDPIGSQLIRDERLNSVILTGGTPTARLFLTMRPGLQLCAETGGKNALIISSMSDRDLAIKDLIQSTFGHSGQKCSACSLAILDEEIYNDSNFKRQLKDAVESLQVGPCWEATSKVIPLIRPPSDALLKGLTTLEKGESWLVEPKVDPDNPHLWSPGVKWGVKEGSFMHKTELFGPVLGVMKAKSLEEALRLANGTDYGLTSGIHSLDKREIYKWMNLIEAGNCYVNRGITGAIVERQPFGGCKASSFGHGSKAGGPNYIPQFMNKKEVGIPKQKASIPESINRLTAFLDQLNLSSEELGIWFASIANYAYWAKQYSKQKDVQKVVGQDNLFVYKVRKRLGMRIQENDRPLDIFRIIAAAKACDAHLEISYDPKKCPIEITNDMRLILKAISFSQESDEEFIARIKWKAFDRIRFASATTPAIEEAAAESATYLNSEPVLSSGRLELTHYLREVAISYNYHRYGNLGTREGEIRAKVR